MEVVLDMDVSVREVFLEGRAFGLKSDCKKRSNWWWSEGEARAQDTAGVRALSEQAWCAEKGRSREARKAKVAGRPWKREGREWGPDHVLPYRRFCDEWVRKVAKVVSKSVMWFDTCSQTWIWWRIKTWETGKMQEWERGLRPKRARDGEGRGWEVIWS